MVLRHIILPEKHFKANLFFPIMSDRVWKEVHNPMLLGPLINFQKFLPILTSTKTKTKTFVEIGIISDFSNHPTKRTRKSKKTELHLDPNPNLNLN